MKSYTDLEQSKKLAELGLNPKTADMHYFPQTKDDFMLFTVPFNKEETVEEGWAPEIIDAIVPAWSLGALIEMLPKGLKEDNLHIIPSASLWHVGYDFSEHVERTDNLLEAVYATVIWLLDNKYIKKD